MSEGTWRDTKGHHWMDKPTRNRVPLWKEMFDDCTTPMSGKEHVQAHRDTKHYGIVGAMSLLEIRRLS